MTLILVIVAAMLLLPSAAHAQVDVVFSGTQPILRANVGPYVISAPVGARGIDVRGVNVSMRGRSASTTTTRRSPSSRASASASSILATADSYVGTPYKWGGETPRGFDCSGFVQYVFREHGIELPRSSRQQVQVGEVLPVGLDALEPGDLMFFASNGSRIDHVAIYAGNNEIIQSSSSGGGVGYLRLTTDTRRARWFVTHHVASRRVISAGGLDLVGPLSAALRRLMPFDPPDHAPLR